MELSYKGISGRAAWPENYRLPDFDIERVKARTKETPKWLHMGAGNIFRVFPAAALQDLLERGLADTGILVCECYDEEIIPVSFEPHDFLSLAVTLYADGHTDKRVIASMTGSVPPAELNAVLKLPSLQMVSFTITEKGYNPANETIARVAEGLAARFEAGAAPLALVSMDNCSRNGERLKEAVLAALENQNASPELKAYVNEKVSFPWSMIDKITPRPSETVAEILRKDGLEDVQITETAKHTFVANFVNAESCQYLVLEDDFPNGRPALEKTGIFMADRDTVEKAEQMKVSCCLNPLHTFLSVAGMLLNKPTIAACMKDERLVKWIRLSAGEAMPVAANPGVLDPERFLNEVLSERFPNPFIPDTPARIVSDTSQKIPMRFGTMLKARVSAGLGVSGLKAFPFFAALWLRYLKGTDDSGNVISLSADYRLKELTALVEEDDLHPILSDKSIFGVDLYEAGLGERIEMMYRKLKQPGKVAEMLDA